VFRRNQNQPVASFSLRVRDVGKHNSSSDLHIAIDLLREVRIRILANHLLRNMVSWCGWILIGLILTAAFREKLASAVISAAALIVVGAVVICVWAWRNRPSIYHVACRLDAAAGIHERISTALCFGTDAKPNELISLQRRDALNRLSQLKFPTLFPIEKPATGRRTLMLAVIALGLFSYRMYHHPPMMALLQKTNQSHLVQSILLPLERAMEKELQKSMALVNPNTKAADGNRASELTVSADGLWQNETAQADDGQQGLQNSTAQQQDESSSPGFDSEGNRQSMAKSILQTLKDMLSKERGQGPPPSVANQQQVSRPDLQQTDSAAQVGKKDNDGQRAPKGEVDLQQKSPINAGDAATKQPIVSDQLKSSPLTVRTVRDPVALDSSNFTGQPRMRTGGDVGTAKIAVRDISPRATAGINGKEQENIPARYRNYVQSYFQRADDTKQ
jgi:hypothetical protein